MDVGSRESVVLYFLFDLGRGVIDEGGNLDGIVGAFDLTGTFEDIG